MPSPLLGRCRERNVKLLALGQTNRNTCIEGLNGRLWAERLNKYRFLAFEDVYGKKWGIDINDQKEVLPEDASGTKV